MEEKAVPRGASISSAEQEELLRIARNALVTYVTEGWMPVESPAPPALSVSVAVSATRSLTPRCTASSRNASWPRRPRTRGSPA